MPLVERAFRGECFFGFNHFNGFRRLTNRKFNSGPAYRQRRTLTSFLFSRAQGHRDVRELPSLNPCPFHEPMGQVSMSEVRPHPGPLPHEREKRFPRLGHIMASDLHRSRGSMRKLFGEISPQGEDFQRSQHREKICAQLVESAGIKNSARCALSPKIATNAELRWLRCCQEHICGRATRFRSYQGPRVVRFCSQAKSPLPGVAGIEVGFGVLMLRTTGSVHFLICACPSQKAIPPAPL